ncbi:MAG: TRAP transporter small permease [Candidatus Polarisedimenticolaceae bacterium]|nr:TRAP transporter small permease [Candidatus Polarisedimenticolaceae bacterium]
MSEERVKSPVLRGFRQVLDAIGSTFFLILFLTILLQVFSRYVLNDPIGWTAEICLIAYLWLAFWGGGLMAGRQDQVRFDLFYNHLSPRARRVIATIRSLIVAAILLIALPANFDYIQFMEYDTTGVLEIGFDGVFAIFIIFMAALLLRNLYRVIALLGKNWRSEI